jgi:glycosyltransferase involved in cell wall biosynthesis/Fe-S-cluster containining protein
MRVAHSVYVVPGQSGLYATAHNMVLAERALGIDAQIVPLMPTDIEEDRGVPIARDGLKDCSVIVSHHGITELQRVTGLPLVYIMHGEPRLCHAHDLAGKTECFYSKYFQGYRKVKQLKAFVMIREVDVPYWKHMYGPERLRVVNAPVDLDWWNLDGDGAYDFGGHRAKINIAAPDTWRLTKDPFEMIHAFSVFAERHPEAKLHIYGIREENQQLDKLPLAWTALLTPLKDRGCMGELRTWKNDLREVYHSCDMVITSDICPTNVVREALACGCPVVAGDGNRHAPYTANPRFPEAFADEMERALADAACNPQIMRESCRAIAEKSFDRWETGRQMVEILKSVDEGLTADVPPGHPPAKMVWWFGEGLRFKCLPNCTECCGQNGAIFLSGYDIKQLAKTQGMTEEAFAEKHTHVFGGKRIALKWTDEGRCPFVTSTGCSVHGSHPVQCQTFPFWPEHAMNPTGWEKAKRRCPGVGFGELYDGEHIENEMTRVSLMRMRSEVNTETD